MRIKFHFHLAGGSSFTFTLQEDQDDEDEEEEVTGSDATLMRPAQEAQPQQGTFWLFSWS